jgi:hypothetical protein
MPLFISRRGFFAALAFSLSLTSFAPAGTVDIPQDDPAVSVDIPDSWKPEETADYREPARAELLECRGTQEGGARHGIYRRSSGCSRYSYLVGE